MEERCAHFSRIDSAGGAVHNTIFALDLVGLCILSDVAVHEFEDVVEVVAVAYELNYFTSGVESDLTNDVCMICQ